MGRDPFSAWARAGQAHLRILATTDIHCHVWPYDYYADRPTDTLGLARTASLIAAARAEARNTMLVDNGDYLQGNPMGDHAAGRGMRPGELHPVIAAMNTLGYDAGTLGNHDFNYGVAFLDLVNAGANFPIVCANFARSLGTGPCEDDLHLPPYVLLDRAIADGAGAALPIRVGLIGFLPPQTIIWDRNHLAGAFAARDIVEAARAWVPEMRGAGADIVVALCHSGVDAGPATPGMENAALPLAGVEGIDAVICGHAHRVFPSDDYSGEGIDAAAGTLMGKPAVMPGLWGSHLGLIDLLLARDGVGWRVTASQTEARPIYARRDGKAVALARDHAPAIAATAAAHRETLDYARAGVGQTATPLRTYFALVAADPATRIVAKAQIWYVTEMLAGTKWQGLPVLSAAAPFKSGGRGGPEYYTDVPAGPIAIRNVADVYPFPNTVQAVAITGAQVRDWLERSAGIYNRVTPGGADQMLIDPDFPAFNFDVIDGVSYAIDVTQPSKFDREGNLANPDANRIVDLSYNGAPIDPRQKFVVATNSFRAGGGGNFPGADGSTVILAAPDTNRDAIMRYIRDRGTISPAPDDTWRLAPTGGATVLLDSGPAAVAYLDQLRARGIAIARAGKAPGGFERFRVTL